MCRAISELYSEPLDPVESLHLFCRLLSFHFSGGKMPLWAGSCGTYPARRLQVLFPSAGDPCSLLGHDSKLKESVLVPRRCEQWFWVTPPLWLNPHHKAEDWSRSLLGLELVVTWCCFFFPPSCPVACLCDIVQGKGTVGYYIACSAFMGSNQRCTSVLWTVTPRRSMSRCPEMFPLTPLPACQNKYLIWKSRYRSQLDCTKGPVSLLLLLLLF